MKRSFRILESSRQVFRYNLEQFFAMKGIQQILKPSICESGYMFVQLLNRPWHLQVSSWYFSSRIEGFPFNLKRSLGMRNQQCGPWRAGIDCCEMVMLPFMLCASWIELKLPQTIQQSSYPHLTKRRLWMQLCLEEWFGRPCYKVLGFTKCNASILWKNFDLAFDTILFDQEELLNLNLKAYLKQLSLLCQMVASLAHQNHRNGPRIHQKLETYKDDNDDGCQRNENSVLSEGSL